LWRSTMETTMDMSSIGTGILFHTTSSRPLPAGEWEKRCDILGYVSEEWWFKGAVILSRCLRAARACLEQPVWTIPMLGKHA
jgi:hypothetical protein